MKTLGLIGGMSWESSSEYYRILNKLIQKEKGAYHSCKCYLHSVNFQEIYNWQKKENNEAIINYMLKVIKDFENAGVDLILICTNTMHQYYNDLQTKSNIKILHIAEVTGKEIVKKGLKNPLLLGTKYTMEKKFYKKYLEDNFHLNVLTPDKKEKEEVHRIIFDELVKGKKSGKSRKKLIDIINYAEKRGADGAILACTELPLIIKQKHADIKLFDTSLLHAKEAVKLILN